jgi:hypothetical protein
MARATRDAPLRLGFALVATSILLFVLTLGLAFTVFGLATATLAVGCMIYGVMLLARTARRGLALR